MQHRLAVDSLWHALAFADTHSYRVEQRVPGVTGRIAEAAWRGEDYRDPAWGREYRRFTTAGDIVEAEYLRITALTTSMAGLWRKFGIVYNLDPDLWAELAAVADDDVIPLEVLHKQLPHVNPYIHMPVPVPLLQLDGQPPRAMTGFFVHGGIPLADFGDGTTGAVPCPSNHPRMGALHFHFCAPALGPDGRPVIGRQHPGTSHRAYADVMWFRTSTLGLAGPTVTFGDLSATRQKRLNTTPVFAITDSAKDVNLDRCLRAAVAILLYAAARNADISPPRVTTGGVPRRPNAKTKHTPATSAQVMDVGYTVGAALGRWRADRDAAGTPGDERAATGTRRRPKPHMRRSHPHLYWTGPGRTQPMVRWLFPTAVNASLGDAQAPTVVPVK